MGSLQITPEFIDEVKSYRKYIHQCYDCGFFWYSGTEEIDQGSREKIEKVVSLLNDLHFSVEDLAACHIWLSHGVCHLCYRAERAEKIRAKQLEEGFFPCFSTANEGWCDQPSCAYYQRCVVNHYEFISWQQRRNAPKSHYYY